MTTPPSDLPVSRHPIPKVGILFFVLIACVALGIGFYPVYVELRYRHRGVATRAQVVRKERHYSGGRNGGGWHNTLKYSYEGPAGEPFEGQGDVCLALWKQSEEGHDLAIEYLRNRPSESRPVDSSFSHWADVVCVTGFVGGQGLIILFFLAYGVIEEHRKRPRK